MNISSQAFKEKRVCFRNFFILGFFCFLFCFNFFSGSLHFKNEIYVCQKREEDGN